MHLAIFGLTLVMKEISIFLIVILKFYFCIYYVNTVESNTIEFYDSDYLKGQHHIQIDILIY